MKEIVDSIEMNCYNRDTIGLHHPSMHQDLILNNRLTEIDYMNGAVVRKGKNTEFQHFVAPFQHH